MRRQLATAHYAENLVGARVMHCCFQGGESWLHGKVCAKFIQLHNKMYLSVACISTSIRDYDLKGTFQLNRCSEDL
jgi:hypothetical protein